MVLNRTRRDMKVDFERAAVDALRAANTLVRVFGYLSAELGLTDDEKSSVRPDRRPAAWDLYVEPWWDEWSLTFHRLRRADQRMTESELNDVIADLIVLTLRWLEGIGLSMVDDPSGGFGLYWTRLVY